MYFEEVNELSQFVSNLINENLNNGYKYVTYFRHFSLGYSMSLDGHIFIKLDFRDLYIKHNLSDIFIQISRINKLKILNIYIDRWIYSKGPIFENIIEIMEILAKNCLILKSLIIDLRFTNITDDLLKVFSKFKQLTRIDIRFNYNITYNLNIFNDLLSGVKQLTHLTLTIDNSSDKTQIDLFESIAHYSPNLVYLKLNIDCVIDLQIFLRFPKLSKLQTLIIDFIPYGWLKDYNIIQQTLLNFNKTIELHSQTIIRHIVLNCDKINSINIGKFSEQTYYSIINSSIIGRQIEYRYKKFT